MRRNAALVILAVAMATLFVSMLPAGATADIIPLRTGTVVSKTDITNGSYIELKDAQGKTFWVLTAACTVGEGGALEVLAGAHYESVKSEQLDRVLKDVYTAQLLRIDGVEIKGYGAHGLPAGCINLR